MGIPVFLSRQRSPAAIRGWVRTRGFRLSGSRSAVSRPDKLMDRIYGRPSTGTTTAFAMCGQVLRSRPQGPQPRPSRAAVIQIDWFWKGAQNAADKKAVVLSTDKAFQQISPYRHSKALAESIFFVAANTRRAHGPAFSVTRYLSTPHSFAPVPSKELKERGLSLVT
jgi:Polysaccharide biosynthesis protein